MAVSQLLRSNDYDLFCNSLTSEKLIVKEVDVGDIEITQLKLESTNGGSTTLKTETSSDYTLIFPDDPPSINNQLLAIDDFTTGKLKYITPGSTTLDVINCNTLNAAVVVNSASLVNTSLLQTDTLLVTDKVTSSLGEIDSLQVNEIDIANPSTTNGLNNTGNITTTTLNVSSSIDTATLLSETLTLKGTTNSVTILPQTSTNSYSFQLPSNAPADVNQVLAVDNLSGNILKWYTIPSSSTPPKHFFRIDDKRGAPVVINTNIPTNKYNIWRGYFDNNDTLETNAYYKVTCTIQWVQNTNGNPTGFFWLTDTSGINKWVHVNDINPIAYESRNSLNDKKIQRFSYIVQVLNNFAVPFELQAETTNNEITYYWGMVEFEKIDNYSILPHAN